MLGRAPHSNCTIPFASPPRARPTLRFLHWAPQGMEDMYESLKNLGTTLVQRDGDAAHRLVLHALDTLMRTPLVEQVEELRSKHRRLHEQAAASALAQTPPQPATLGGSPASSEPEAGLRSTTAVRPLVSPSTVPVAQQVCSTRTLAGHHPDGGVHVCGNRVHDAPQGAHLDGSGNGRISSLIRPVGNGWNPAPNPCDR